MARDSHRFRVPVEAEIVEKLRAFARDLDVRMPQGYGFTLLMFPFGEEGVVTYISNAERETMLKAMSEFIRVNSDT